MKLKLRIVFYIIYTIALLKFSLSDNKLILKNNKENGNSLSKISIRNFQNNMIEFPQKV